MQNGSQPNNENSNSFSNSGLVNSNRMVTRQGPVKHYEVPNLSSMLYEYTNKETDIVQSAFRRGNYQSIRGLPDEIRPYSVGQAVKEKIAENALMSSIIGQNNTAYNELLKGDGGVFSKFQWKNDPFEAAKEQ